MPNRSRAQPHSRVPLTSERGQSKPETGRFGCSLPGRPTGASIPIQSRTIATSPNGTPGAFFERFFVLNYCPLMFLEASGRNRTPDKLPKAEREPMTAACDRALAASIEALAPRSVIGIGVYARDAARRVVADRLPVGCVLHPSPASPKANRGWAQQAEADLVAAGIIL